MTNCFKSQPTKGESLKIKDLITSEAKYISPDISLSEAAKKMRKLSAGILLIRDQDCVLGTVTDRDIIVRAVSDGLDPNVVKVRQVMTRGLIGCFQDRTIEEAGQLMQKKKIRHLPVLDEGSHPVGIVSLPDAAALALDRALASGVLERVFSPQQTGL